MSKNSVSVVSSTVELSLNDKWTLFYHDMFDKNWTLESYMRIIQGIEYVHQLIALNETIPDSIIKNAMLFLFRQGVNPFWEDPKNRDGGYLSFKLDNSVVHNVWKSFVYALCGETLFKRSEMNECVNGISISPKKTFCILKSKQKLNYFLF
jgi:hypothetical protein